MKKLLISDDSVQILEVLRQYAIREGYEVFLAKDGVETLEEFYKRQYDAVLLDVMMPKKDGFEVCKEIRKTSMVPIIMITARGEDYEKIMGLDMGADDYVIKPFSPSEVMARLRAILRRVEALSEVHVDVIEKGTLKIYLEKCKVYVANQEVLLTKKEAEILILLSSNTDKVFSRTHILESVWGCDYFGDARTIDTHIKRLRAKLEKYNHPDWEIITVRGFGYKFEVKHE